MKNFFLILIALISFESKSWSAITESTDLIDVLNQARQLSLQFRPEEILVVYDIDSTLLSSPPTLFGDQWMMWQNTLLASPSPEDKQFALAKDFASFFQIYRRFLPLLKSVPTQEDAADIHKRISEMKIKQIVLTARGPENRSETEAQLEENGFRFWDANETQYLVEKLAYNPKNLSQDCLNSEFLAQFKIKPAKVISVGKNLIFAQGQHKGMILKTFLCNSVKKYKAVIFVDDLKKNTEAVDQVLVNEQQIKSLTVYRYGRKDALNAEFSRLDKSQLHEQWLSLDSKLKEIFK